MAIPAAEEFGGTERFLVRGRLGAGGFGVVYKVLDQERNTLVALKTLRHVAPKSLYRFKQEFRALADVSHPNLVTLYELSSDAEQWFFTMELIDGVGFLQHVRKDRARGEAQSTSSGVSWQTSPDSDTFFKELLRAEQGVESPVVANGLHSNRLRAALPQLAEGVLALHAAGKLHRDIKPSNVLVTREGRVVLLDFGLVRELQPEDTHTVDAVGTPAYMSPEQASGQALTEASDWYNVGVMLYEALTGRLPFSGRALEVLRQKQESEPPAPEELAPDAPADLAALCRDLLRREPGKRPAGAEVLRRLQGAAAPPAVFVVAPQAPGSVPFVGRSHELEALRDAFANVKQGRAVTVAVQGGSGMGKTALVRRFLEELKDQDGETVVLAGRCYERESVPYKALDTIVDALSQYLRRLPSANAEALLPHDVHALIRLFPVLRQVRAVAQARRAVLEIPDSQELRRRAFDALRELFTRLGDRRPLVLFIDDMQWGDEDSAALLEVLLRPPDPPALLLIGCYRSEEAGTSPLLRAILPKRANVAAALLRRDIGVGELPPPEARRLAATLLGAEQRAGGADAIARESGGNPYFIEELARFSQPGVQPLSEMPAELTLREVIKARVSRLPDPARHLLDLVAVAGRPIALSVAYRAAELERDGPKVLAVLRSAHLVRTRATSASDEIETYHDRIRDAVAGDLSQESLRECHHRLALALVASGRLDLEMLAVHFQGAGDTQTAAEYAAAAAAKASEALAFDRAATLYRFALTLRAEARIDHGDLPVKLADALANAGRGAEAAQAYLSAAKTADTAQGIDLHRRAAEQLLVSGHIEDGRRVLNTVLKKLEMPYPEPRGALVSLLARRVFIRLRGLGFTERDEALVPPHELLRIDTCWSVAVGLSQVDMLRGAGFQARHLLLALKAGEPYRVARALAVEVAYVAMGGNRDRGRTERLLHVARGVCERVNHPHTTGLLTLMEGAAAWLDGRWEDGRAACERAERLLRERCTGVVWEILGAQMFQLAGLFFLGELAEMSRRLPTLLKEAEERGDLLKATILRIGYCSHVVWLAADNPQTARQELEAGLATWSGRFDYLQLWARGARTDIALYSGESPPTLEQIGRRRRLFLRSLNRFVQIGFIRGLESWARSELAVAARKTSPLERDALLRAVRAQAGTILREKTHWGDPLAVLLQGGAAATAGETERSLALLESAEHGFAAASMALHAAVARRRRGELLGGDTGRELVAAADLWMAGQGIKSPERMTAMLAPGRWRAG